jgi:hypothetical protein
MIGKRSIAAVFLFALGMALSSCSGSGGFAGAVADNWPHWAGGMPAGVPPRPGAPGYDEFVSHGGATPVPAATPAVTFQQRAANGSVSTSPSPPVASAPAPQPSPAPQPAPAAQAAPEAENPAEDASVVKGGLY